MAQHERDERPHVVRSDERPSVSRRVGLRRDREREPTTWAHAQAKFGHTPGRRSDRDDVTEHRRGKMDAARDIGHPDYLGAGKYRVHLIERLTAGPVLQDLHLGFVARIADFHPDHEPVDLGFGEIVGTAVFHRVLGCDDHEGPGYLVGDAVHRDLAFLHDLQERRLRFR